MSTANSIPLPELRAPYPWAGGKRRVAHLVWPRFGDAPNYVEPFFGSGAVMLARPGGAGKIETANDVNAGVVNFWRAVTDDPEGVAYWCDWPVSEVDLNARHAWLVRRLDPLREVMENDPDAYDAKVAGWWCWGICQWIGAGWCDEEKRFRNEGARPHASGKNAGVGVHRLPQKMIPRLAARGTGVVGALSEVSKLYQAVPSIGNDRGVHGLSAPPARQWFVALQRRLRRVRWVCGDWRRVLTDSVLGKGRNVGGRKPTAVFLDPPYDTDLRTERLYAADEPGLSRAVRDWAVERGDDPDLRIALCGLEGEHEMPPSWEKVEWTGARGYGGSENGNRYRERIWFSRGCLSGGQLGLF